MEAASPAHAAWESKKAHKSKEREAFEEASDEFNKQWSKDYGIEEGRIFLLKLCGATIESQSAWMAADRLSV